MTPELLEGDVGWLTLTGCSPRQELKARLLTVLDVIVHCAEAWGKNGSVHFSPQQWYVPELMRTEGEVMVGWTRTGGSLSGGGGAAAPASAISQPLPCHWRLMQRLGEIWCCYMRAFFGVIFIIQQKIMSTWQSWLMADLVVNFHELPVWKWFLRKICVLTGHWWITLKDGLHGHGRARKRRTSFIFTGGGYDLCSRPFRITFKIPLAEIGPMESRNPT